MRAKLTIYSVTRNVGSESLKFTASYTGSQEDNTYSSATATPSASLEMTITNPDLIGTFTPGQSYFVDFTPIAETKA